MYPNEVELQWSVLIVLYPVPHRTRRRRVHPRLSRTRLPRRSRQAHLPPRAAHRARVSASSRRLPLQLAPRPSRAFARNVPHAAPLLGHGHVRLRLPLVPDGCAVARNLARLPQGHRSALADFTHWIYAPDLSRADPRLRQHQPALARIDDRLGYIITIIGIPSAFLLHGYVGFIFGSIKANPWWSSPAHAGGVHLLRHGLGHRRRHAALHALTRLRGYTHRHALPRHHRASIFSTSSSSISASKCST